jgi:acyl-CoA reductase-like NAD-dependent aldehyde dehydrogenase
MKIYNPATEELIKEVHEDDNTSLLKKYSAVKQGQKSWENKPISERIAVIKKFIALLNENIETLAHDLHLETGKLLQEAQNEIHGACSRSQFFIDDIESTLQEKTIREIDGIREVLAFEPLGVITNISAWNYPYLVGVNVFIPALLAGNAVLYKPSEYATITGLHIEQLLHEAGVPDNVFTLVAGTGAIGSQLLDLPLQGYFFTGSYAIGKRIAEATAHKLVPVGLELGGKDPVYVMDDVTNVEVAAMNLVEGTFYNNGQSCCAVERIYVHEKIYDGFINAYLKETQKLINPPPLTRPQQIEVLIEQVEDALSKGATLLLGGHVMKKPGAFFEPTILTHVNHSMKVMKDESFGPIIGIQKVFTDKEALELMQDTEYGLTAGVYGRDEERAKKLLKKMDAGTGYFNCCDRVSPFLPWSGRRHSGLGSTLSYLGILAFVKPKAYMLRTEKIQ